MHATSHPSELTRYLDDAGHHDRLDAEEEQQATRELVAARRQCWREVLPIRDRFASLLENSKKTVAEGGVDDIVPALDAADPDRSALEDVLRDETVDREIRTALRRARRRYRRLRNRFASHNLRLVVSIAKRYGRLHLPLADRVQEGNLGLLKAVDRFDPGRGTRFSTYATWWIRHTVTRALMRHGRTVRVPGHLHTAFTKIRRVRPTLVAELGRDPTDEELSERTGVAVERVGAAIVAMERRAVGLETSVGDTTHRTLADTLVDERPRAWTDRLERSIDVPLATRALEGLDAKARRIVRHRFELEGAEHKTLRELGDEYGVSRERVRQLQVRALKELRQSMQESAVPSIDVR